MVWILTNLIIGTVEGFSAYTKEGTIVVTFSLPAAANHVSPFAVEFYPSPPALRNSFLRVMHGCSHMGKVKKIKSHCVLELCLRNLEPNPMKSQICIFSKFSLNKIWKN